MRNSPPSSPKRRSSTFPTCHARTRLSRSHRGDRYLFPATTLAAARAAPHHPALPVLRAILVPLAPRPGAPPLVPALTADLLTALLRKTASHAPLSCRPSHNMAVFAQLPPIDELPKGYSELRRFLSAVEQPCSRLGPRARPLDIALDHMSFLLRTIVERNREAKFPNRRRTYTTI
ncbi:hypothetical protein Efla_004559 [Eimeria flavescens]